SVGGGLSNWAYAAASTVGGGFYNTASGLYSTVSGGYDNTADGLTSTVAGGRSNTASGAYAFAGGKLAFASRDGEFVWADSTNAAFDPQDSAHNGNGLWWANAANTFNVRAKGGVM